MVASRDVLKDENKLLVDLEKTASGSPAGETGRGIFASGATEMKALFVSLIQLLTRIWRMRLSAWRNAQLSCR